MEGPTGQRSEGLRLPCVPQLALSLGWPELGRFGGPKTNEAQASGLSMKATNGPVPLPRLKPFAGGERRAGDHLPKEPHDMKESVRYSRQEKQPRRPNGGHRGSEWPELGLWVARDRNATPSRVSTRRELMRPWDGGCRWRCWAQGHLWGSGSLRS